MTNNLATASVSSRLSGMAGRAIVSARGHHIIVDSPLSLGGPNEEINPIDVLLAALATCGTFICETAALERGIPLHQVNVSVAGDFDPRGICGEPVDPSILALRVRLSLSGPTQAEAETLAADFKQRCPVYGTLAKATPTEVEVVLERPPSTQERKEIRMKRLRCRDAGFDCDHEIVAASEDEVLQQAAEHVTGHHHLDVTPELVEQVKGLIQDVDGDA